MNPLRETTDTRLFAARVEDGPSVAEQLVPFPSKAFDSFESACMDVANRSPQADMPVGTESTGDIKTVLIIGQPYIVLKSVIHLKKHQHLHIRYEVPSADKEMQVLNTQLRCDRGDHDNHGDDDDRPPCANIVAQDLHSMFLLNGQSRLTLENVNLHHKTSIATIEDASSSSTQHQQQQQQEQQQQHDHTQIGAAINLRNKSRVQVLNGKIISDAGFCCWAVQKSQIVLAQCHLQSFLRSAVVCFGQVKCSIADSAVEKCGVHGVCARGSCTLTLANCMLMENTIRALYSYAGASVSMKDCHVAGTIRPDKAAIEIVSSPPLQSSAESQKHVSSLVLMNCVIENNAGAGVCVRGDAKYDFQGNTISKNNLASESQSDVQLLPSLHEDDDNREDEETAGALRTGDSSYRMGDWRCHTCEPKLVVVKATVARCPFCQTAKELGGEILTMAQVLECNRQGPQALVIYPSTSSSSSTNELELNLSSRRRWLFDGDDKGWIPYDRETCQTIEEAYQVYVHHQSDSSISNNPSGNPNQNQLHENGTSLHILRGKYEINFITMEQINIQTQFIRYIKRRG